jgi:hypothetical protein
MPRKPFDRPLLRRKPQASRSKWTRGKSLTAPAAPWPSSISMPIPRRVHPRLRGSKWPLSVVACALRASGAEMRIQVASVTDKRLPKRHGKRAIEGS